MESHFIPNVDNLYYDPTVANRSGWRSYTRHASEFNSDYGDDFIKARTAFGRAFNEVNTNPDQELHDLHSLRYPRIINTSSLPRFNVPPEGLYIGTPLRDRETEVPRDSTGYTDAKWPNLLAHRARSAGYGSVPPLHFRNGDASDLRQEEFGYARFGIQTGHRRYHAVLPNRTRPLEKELSQTPFAPSRRVSHDYLFETFGGEDCLGGEFQPLNSNGWSFHCDLKQSSSDLGNIDGGASSTFVHQTLPPSSQRCETIDGENRDGFEEIDNPTLEEHQGSPENIERPFDSKDDSRSIPRSDLFVDTSDFTGSSLVGDESTFADPELSVEEVTADDHVYPSRSAFSCDYLPTPQRHRHNSQNSTILQWRRITAVIASLRRQRRRLRQERDLLRRQKAALDMKWRDLQQTQRRGTYGRDRRSKRRHGDCDYEAYRTEYFRKGERSYYGDNARTSNGKSKPKTRGDRFPYADEDLTDGEELSDRMPEPDQYPDPISPITRPQPTAAAIAEANIAIQSYESAWASLSSSTSPIPLKIPYPTPNQQPEGLLAHFPPYISLAPCPLQRPRTDSRIQYHALEFYLRPLGIQPRPTTSNLELASWSIPGIKEAEGEMLEKSKVMMDKEVARWHEDRLRKKGFGDVFDGNGTVLEIENEPFEDHVCDNKQCRLRQFENLKWTRITEKEVVQGVWAAVHLLREYVIKEMEERKRK
ncbi:hypothetical protein MMC30_006488 [Trapelia coarctata]|nr:hypothetical protein [Trapelia coarctata]